MKTKSLQNRIVVDPNILGGKPVIAGTRIPAHMVLGLLASGMSPNDILKEYYPQLTKASIQAAVKYAAKVVEGEEIRFIEKKRDKVYEASFR